MSCSKLKFSLANNALFNFFNHKYWSADEIDFLNNFCYGDEDRNWKFKMRLLYEENNDMIVGAVFADATEEERLFLRDRFFYNFSLVKIGLELHIHPNGLQHWRDKFLKEISSLMNYNLPVEDIFSRNKVEALIFVLERLIAFYEDYGKTDKKILDLLKFKLSRYQNLLFAIHYFSEYDSSDVAYRIIRTKILNQNVPVNEFENTVGVSHTTVSKYIRLFQKQFYSSKIESCLS